MNEPLTKEKKPRTEAQIQATARMRDALEKKRLTPTEKKLRLKAIKDQLNGITPNKILMRNQWKMCQRRF